MLVSAFQGSLQSLPRPHCPVAPGASGWLALLAPEISPVSSFYGERNRLRRVKAGLLIMG